MAIYAFSTSLYQISNCDSNLWWCAKQINKIIHIFEGVRYLPGGVASGFTHVDNTAEKKLFQVKGKKNIRVKQVYNILIANFIIILLSGKETRCFGNNLKNKHKQWINVMFTGGTIRGLVKQGRLLHFG